MDALRERVTKGTFASSGNFDRVIHFLVMKIMKILRTVSFEGAKLHYEVQNLYQWKYYINGIHIYTYIVYTYIYI